jgi:hypothetical protein
MLAKLSHGIFFGTLTEIGSHCPRVAMQAPLQSIQALLSFQERDLSAERSLVYFHFKAAGGRYPAMVLPPQ